MAFDLDACSWIKHPLDETWHIAPTERGWADTICGLAFIHARCQWHGFKPAHICSDCLRRSGVTPEGLAAWNKVPKPDSE